MTDVTNPNEPSRPTNWRDAFPVQQLTAETGKVFILQFHSATPDKGVHVSIEKFPVTCELTEQELVEELNRVVSTFTHSSTGNGPFQILRAQNDVAKRSHRGQANTVWNNSCYYKGSTVNAGDGPLVVAEHNGMFGIVLNPDFDNYGFIIR